MGSDRIPQSARVAALVLLFSIIVFSCRREYGTVEQIELNSAYLEKTMRVPVFLPPEYNEAGAYPVLYFVPYAGGGAGVITYALNTNASCRKVFSSPSVEEMIVVGVPHDGSFLFDADPPHESLVLPEGIELSKGYYESFFLDELIPTIEAKFAVDGDRSRRYIGGYSLGGHAALRIGLEHIELFSKIGAHSPTLFEVSLPNAEVTEFMYPDSETRQKRDPLLIVSEIDFDQSVSVYIDTGMFDINLDACRLMYERLIAAGADAQFHELSGTHGIAYMSEHLPEYLEFYGTIQ